ncbi:MAG TPA: hemerythrin domain-containing protein [Candidatus Thermoplasmatota archaeon]|nr:hemerythrin domain-containing protein [Candidatus Thermoplasmatota archaeon]
MTRHHALRPLSEEHQHVLEHCKALEAVIGTWDPRAHHAVRRFLEYWDGTFRIHLEAEERYVIRGLRDLEEQARFRSDCNALRNLADLVRVSTFDPTLMEAYLGGLVQGLRHHVRVAEWEVFEDVQDQVKPPHLETLARILQEFRAKAKGPAMGARTGDGGGFS